MTELPLLGKGTEELDVHVIVEPQYLYRVFYSVDEQDLFVIRVLQGVKTDY